MHGEKAQVRQASLHKEVALGIRVEPCQKSVHKSVDVLGRRRLEVDFLAPDGAAHDLHRRLPVCSHLDLAQPAVARREQGRVPTEQALMRQRLIAPSHRIEYDIDGSVHIARVDVAREPVHPEPPRHR